jgi:hypothetical protein
MNDKVKPGKTPFQEFQAPAKGLMQVSKSELDKKIRDVRNQKQKKDQNYENSN